MKSRILYIDNLKAFAIFLMVLGHVLQYVIAKDTYKDNIAYNFIYSFHMALFMMTSGYVGGMANSKSWNLNKTLKKRATQLLLPFMSWTILYAIIKQSPIYILESIIYPSRSLWFLWALFCITVAFSFVRKVAQDRWMAIWGRVFLLVLIMKVIDFVFPNILGCGLIAKFQIPYTLGVMIGKRTIHSRCSCKNILFVSVLVMTYLVMFRYYGWDTSTLPLPIPTLINKSLYFLMTIFLGCIGSLVFILLFRYMGNVKSPFLNQIGMETLGIYASHFIFIEVLMITDLYFTPIPSLLRTTFYVTITITTCHVIIHTMRKNPTISHYLLGEQMTA